eukprot:scaffold160909_cov35-Tisochrysis_lutea.AAC.1
MGAEDKREQAEHAGRIGRADEDAQKRGENLAPDNTDATDEEEDGKALEVVDDVNGFLFRCCCGFTIFLVLAAASVLATYVFYSPLIIKVGPYLAPFSRSIELQLRHETARAAHASAVEAARPQARRLVKAAARRARAAVEAEGGQWSSQWDSFL